MRDVDWGVIYKEETIKVKEIMAALQKFLKKETTKNGSWGTSAFRRQEKKMLPISKPEKETRDLLWVVSAHSFTFPKCVGALMLMWSLGLKADSVAKQGNKEV